MNTHCLPVDLRGHTLTLDLEHMNDGVWRLWGCVLVPREALGPQKMDMCVFVHLKCRQNMKVLRQMCQPLLISQHQR